MLDKLYTRLDKFCDVDQVAHILTLRAAALGMYRIYDRKAVSKGVHANEARIAQVPQEELPELMRGWQKQFYRIDDAWNMELIPHRGRKSPSVEEYRSRLNVLLEQERTSRNVPPWRIRRARMMFELAAEAASIVKEVQEKQRAANEEKARQAKEQEEADAYGAFLYTRKE